MQLVLGEGIVLVLLLVVATAYCPCSECCGEYAPEPGEPAITASGTVATAGRTIATDPEVIPTGSRIYVQGFGLRVAEDVGGAIVGNRIDIFMGCHKQAMKFGRRQIKIWILKGD